MTTYRLEFAAPTHWLNANERVPHRWQTKDRRVWRDAAHTWAKARKLPKNLARVRIDATLSFMDERRRDVGNYYPTIKACVDGLIDYGLCADDDDKHLEGPFLHRGPKTTTAIGFVEFEIREVP